MIAPDTSWLHWDGTITFGNALTLAVFVGVMVKFYTKVVRFVDRIQLMIDEFPPHRHLGEETIYPKGMTPNEAKRASGC